MGKTKGKQGVRLSLVGIAVRLVPDIHGVFHLDVGREGLEGEYPVAGDRTMRREWAGLSLNLVQPYAEIGGHPLPPDTIEAGVVQVEDRVWRG